MKQGREVSSGQVVDLDTDRWVPISEFLPHPWNADVIVWDAEDEAQCVASLSGFREPYRQGPVWCADVRGQLIEFDTGTHWRALPPSPVTCGKEQTK